MLRQRAFSAFVILTLAIGIGASTIVFTLVHAVLLRDLPFADPNRLVWMYNLRTERDRAPLSIPDLNDYRQAATSIEGFAAFTNWTANLTGRGDAERLEGVRVAGNFFQLLGSSTRIGRPLQPSDAAENVKVAVITHKLWMRRFASDPSVVGGTVTLNGAAYVIVGVLPVSFVFPFRDAELAVPLPLRDDPRRSDRGANFLRVVARLKSGVTIDQAKADLNAIARRLQRDFPDDDARKTGISLYALQSEIVSDYRQILWTLFAAVGVLLVISCGNLANLILVRSVARRSELALRASLGASRARIVSLLLFESAVLATVGGLAGVVVAYAAIDVWRALGPPSFPRMADVVIDGRVLLFASVAVCGSTVIAGLIPALTASRELSATMAGETRTQTGSRSQGLIRRGFVVLQLAASAMLIVSMGLVAKGFARLARVDPGFEAHGAVSVQLSLPPLRYATRDAIVRFYEAVNDRLTGIPGSQAVGAVSLLPLSGLLNTIDVAFPDRPGPPPDEVPQAHFRVASAGYFEAAGIHVRDGRSFEAADNLTNRPVAIVSRTFAARHWPGASAVGKFLQLPLGPSPLSLEVVGTVDDVKQFTLDREPTADLYVPLLQMPASQAPQLVARMYWVVRSSDVSPQVEPAIQSAVHSVDAEVATSSMRTLDGIVQSSLSPWRINVRLLELLGQVAMVLAAMGVYAVSAFSVGMRRREFAIRAAFGAGRESLAGLVLSDELRPVLLGLALGLAVALGLSPFLQGLAFDVSPADPSTYASAAAALLAVSGIAVLVSVRRAGSIDPAEVLRQ